MTVYDFIELDELQQAKVTWTGVHVSQREDEEHFILLYQLDNFYIEVLYNKSFTCIDKFRPFICTDQLQPYLTKICITNLFG
jgi:hypothetical protein